MTTTYLNPGQTFLPYRATVAEGGTSIEFVPEFKTECHSLLVGKIVAFGSSETKPPQEEMTFDVFQETSSGRFWYNNSQGR